MALLVPIVGAVGLLEIVYGQIDANAWTGTLYVNDHTPALGDTLGDYTSAAYMNTIEMVDVYNAPVDDTGVGGKMLADDFIFEQTDDEAQTAYGWYVVDDDGVVIFAERFPAPIPLAYAGDKVKITGHVFKGHNGS